MKKIIVIGLGISGLAILNHYFNNKEVSVTAYDMKEDYPEDKIKKFLFKDSNVKIKLGQMPTGDEICDVVYLSPVVNTNIDSVKKFLSRNVKVTGEIELSYDFAVENLGNDKLEFIGITGTNGKTTTTSMIYNIYEKYSSYLKGNNIVLNPHIVGNIGNVALKDVDNAVSLCKEKPEGKNVFVTELSSFQLETIYDFHCHIALILNLTPDHIERHLSIENYRRCKYNIFKNQNERDFLILNYEDKNLTLENEQIKGKVIYFSSNRKLENGVYYNKETGDLINNINGKNEIVINRKDINLLGIHNIENTLAAIAACVLDHIPINIIKEGIKTFLPVEHRLEKVETINNITYINDSKGTNPDSSIKAVEAVDSPIILIAGGYDKNVSFHEFINSFGTKVKYLVLFGQTKEKIKETAIKCGYSEKNIKVLNTLKEAVEFSKKEAEKILEDNNIKNVNVLLSPASASWDMYPCFERRGDEFKEIVRSFINK